MNFEELARCTDDFNGAQCKAVCVEAVSYDFWFICGLFQCFFLNQILNTFYIRLINLDYF